MTKKTANSKSKLAEQAKKDADKLAREAEGELNQVEAEAPGYWEQWKSIVGERRAIPVAAISAIVLVGLTLTMCKD